MVHYSMRRRLQIYTAVLVLAASCGCATSPPSRFYALSSLKSPEVAPVGVQGGLIIAIGPTTIPDYIDRSEIVTVGTSNEMQVHDSNRWAGELDRGINRALVEDLAALLPAEKYTVVVWSPTEGGVLEPDYRLSANITRFDGALAGSVSFDVDGTLYGPDGKVLRRLRYRRETKVLGPEFNDLIAAMSRSVEAFGREAASAVIAASGEKPVER